jgi:diaminohydroxyphosphoribosylaminopyrimidine deaminase/5-amino-6-(5-phosphoribosylamino)uracil reductase
VRDARLPLDSVLVRTARETPTIACVTPAADPARVEALRAAGVEVATAPELGASLRALRDRGVASLLVEGGAAVAAALVRERLVDRLVIFQAPVVLGAGALGAFSALDAAAAAELGSLSLVAAERYGDDAVSTYALR